MLQVMIKRLWGWTNWKGSSRTNNFENLQKRSSFFYQNIFLFKILIENCIKNKKDQYYDQMHQS